MADPATMMERGFAAIAAKDLDALGATHHEDVVEDFQVLGPIVGRSQVRAFFSETFAAMPDMVFSVERIMPVDDRIAVGQWRIDGTFTEATFAGIAATGKPVSIRGIDVMEFEDDLLVHNTIYYDGLKFARQVGLLPPEGTRRDRAITSAFNFFTKTKAKLRRSRS